MALTTALRAFEAPTGNEPNRLPAGEILTWGKEPVETKTSTRAAICLNGVWRVMPAIRGASKEPTEDWGYIRVPGSWQGSENRIPGLVTVGNSDLWKEFDGDKVDRMWYERPISIPTDWAGRAILLEFQRMSTDAQVFINDQACDKVNWPEGIVDITSLLTPGKDATLRVLVVATSDASAVEPLLAAPNADVAGDERVNGQDGDRRHRLTARGIVGDVFLYSRPSAGHIEDIFVKTSTKHSQLSLEVELAHVLQAGTLEITVTVLNEKGYAERRFESSLQIKAAKAQIIQPSWLWTDPRIWDIGQPNLYTLVLKIEGAGIADEMKQTFGFREFWIDGRNLYLNGKELRWRPVMGHSSARPVAEEVDGTIDAFMWAGYNFQEIWPTEISMRGQPDDFRIWYERADRKGWPITGVLENFESYAATWDDIETRKRYRAAADAQVRRYRNHPSIIVWNTSANYARGDEHPRVIGNRSEAWNTLGAWTEDRFRKLQEAIELLRTLDGTRPVISHHSGSVGDVYTLNFYMDFIPLQEREEWLSYWAEFGDMPFFCVEFGAPLQTSYHRGRNGFDKAIMTEPLDAEFCAIYLGSQAFALETPEYREQIRRLFRGGQAYARWEDNPAEIFAPNFQKIQELFVGNTWRSWRTMGNTGGMFPWSNAHGWIKTPDGENEVALPPFKPGRRGYYFPTAPKSNLYWLEPEAAHMLPAGKALVENNQPTLAWICGPGGQPNPGVQGPNKAFTAKDHNFRAGQAIEKQIAVLNDARSPQKYSIQWQATVAGHQVASGVKEGTIDSAQTLFVPLTFEAPQHIEGGKADGQITLSVSVGQASHKDSFDFRLFAPVPSISTEFAVYDPAGQTAQLLRLLGCSVHEWELMTAQPLIAVGRSALIARPALLHELEPLVREGARVIVFAQDPEFMRNRLGLRVAWHMSRRVFPVAKHHAVTAGIDATDLSDWSGSSTLVEPYPEGTGEKPFPFSYEPPMAFYGWRWGGRGAVTSASVEKPHRSSWRPILEDQFDLAYSPLMELDYGKGRLIWCMLDLEDHAAQDPGAFQLAKQLVQYVQLAALSPKLHNTYYIGDNAGTRLLDDIGLIYETAEVMPAETGLLIIGANAGLSDDSLSAFVQKGGKALVLPVSGERLPLGGVQKRVNSFHGSLSVPDWPEARGLSKSDLRWRTDADAWLITSGGDIGADGLLARKVLGNGVLLYCQLDPNHFDAENQTYFRFTRWRQTRALCQVLANLGARFLADRLIFTAIPFAADADPWSFEPIKQPSPFYSEDYRDDFALGDDPFRYYDW
jgi:beta-galactosidase